MIHDPVPEELTAILHEIERALEAKLYYVAIAVALSIPDICACLELDPANVWATEKKYTAWWDKYGAGRFKNLTGQDLYRIRGGVVHQGNFDHDKSRFARVMFIGPESAIKMHDVVITIEPGVSFSDVAAVDLRMAGKVLSMDVVKFCQCIIDTAKAWSIAKAGDPFVQKNLPNLVRYRPNGLQPFSIGVPTIA